MFEESLINNFIVIHNCDLDENDNKNYKLF